MRPVQLAFEAVTSQGDNHELSGHLTAAACNLHISVGVESANQSRAPITAYAYHLRAAATASPRVQAGRERTERARTNGGSETDGNLF